MPLFGFDTFSIVSPVLFPPVGSITIGLMGFLELAGMRQ